jgi:hypothetical protein
MDSLMLSIHLVSSALPFCMRIHSLSSGVVTISERRNMCRPTSTVVFSVMCRLDSE